MTTNADQWRWRQIRIPAVLIAPSTRTPTCTWTWLGSFSNPATLSCRPSSLLIRNSYLQETRKMTEFFSGFNNAESAMNRNHPNMTEICCLNGPNPRDVGTSWNTSCNENAWRDWWGLFHLNRVSVISPADRSKDVILPWRVISPTLLPVLQKMKNEEKVIIVREIAPNYWWTKNDGDTRFGWRLLMPRTSWGGAAKRVRGEGRVSLNHSD